MFEETVAVKVGIPVSLNHQLEQLKYLQGISKGEVIGYTIERRLLASIERDRIITHR
jgi:hypothetical protein